MAYNVRGDGEVVIYELDDDGAWWRAWWFALAPPVDNSGTAHTRRRRRARRGKARARRRARWGNPERLFSRNARAARVSVTSSPSKVRAGTLVGSPISRV
jgi:hypothetical protein